MRTKQKTTKPSLSYIVRSETHGELTSGCPVKISGERGSWRFLHHCVNTDTGAEWLDVFGGDREHETLRAFRADRVTLIRPKGTRRSRKPKLPELTLEDLI